MASTAKRTVAWNGRAKNERERDKDTSLLNGSTRSTAKD
jgi:hypothetical protein